MIDDCKHRDAQPDTVRVAGSIPIADAPIRWGRIRRVALGLRPPCCECRAHVQITTSLVTRVTQSDGPVLVQALPDALDPRTIRFNPYIKVRVQTCRYARPVWIDVGRTIVVPWDAASVSIVIPETVSADGITDVPAQWLVGPSEGVTIPRPIAGQNLQFDTRVWVSQKCTLCCEYQDAILTDSAIGTRSPGALPIFLVPPGADQVEIVAGQVGAQVDALWAVGTGALATTQVIGESGFGSGAFGDQSPRCICVAPGTTHIILNTAPNDFPVLVAWRIRL